MGIQGASTLNETEVEEMLVEAEKFAAADKEKRQNIDLKNQAEALCFEAEKELSTLKSKISEEKQKEITTLIEKIRQNSQNDDLKLIMKEIVTTKYSNEDESSANSMSDLNDI